jgi:hypothetical protein
VLSRFHALAEQQGAVDPLEPLIVAARRCAERDVEEREAEGIPPPRRPALARFVAPAAIVALAAASALLVIGGLSWIAERRTVSEERSQAASAAERHEVQHEISTPEPPAAPRRDRPQRAPQIDAADTTGAPSEPAPLEGTSTRGKRTDIEDRLRALAEAAEAALGRGELQRADDTLAKLITIGGRHRLVELAYGDRFTIAHRRGIIPEQTKLWRAYLQRFPLGRFADDARAGLCRHAPEAARTACWQRYLDEFPSGAYQAAARRAITASGGE